MDAENIPLQHFGERLRVRISKVFPTLTAFCAASSMPYRSLQQYLSGETLPSAEVIVRVAAHLDTNIHWLMTGQGVADIPKGSLQVLQNGMVVLIQRARIGSPCNAKLADVQPVMDSTDLDWRSEAHDAGVRAEEAEARAREIEAKADVRVVALEAEIRELKREDALARSEEVSMARGLGLEHVALMALRGTQELTWKVIVTMHESEQPVTFEHLAAAVHADSTQKLKELKAELMILEREGIVSGEGESERLYQLRKTSTLVRARASGDLGQAAGEFLRSFVREILPATMESQGYFTRIVAKIPKARVQEVTRNLRAEVFNLLEQAEKSGDDGEEDVCVLLGIRAPHQPA